MSNENRFIGQSEIVAGNEAGSLRSPEAQASYLMERAKVEAMTQNTKAIGELTKAVEAMSFALIGEMMSLKETIDTCLNQNGINPILKTLPAKEKTK